MATRTRAPRGSRMRTICTGEEPPSAIAIHTKREPQNRPSSASRARVPRPMATGLPGRQVHEVAPRGAKRARTADPLLAKQVLYQLSYSPKRHPGYLLPEQGGQFGDGLDQVGGAGGLEAGRLAGAGHADRGRGAARAAAGDDVLAVADDRDRGDVLDAETEDRGEHQVR